MDTATPELKYKLSVADTLLAIPLGESRTFCARETFSIASARSFISRFNGAGCEEKDKRLTVTTEDNGVTFTVKRQRK